MTARDTSWRVRFVRLIRELGSYGAIALIIPGGSLIAFFWWMLRHRAWLAARTRRALAALLAFGAGLIFPR